MAEPLAIKDHVVQDALDIREIYIEHPVETPDLTDPDTVSVTEESVIAALRKELGGPKIEILSLRDKYLRLVRQLLRPGVDPKV